MGRIDTPALKGSWLGTILMVLNPFVKFLLRSQLHWPLSRWFLVLSWKGAKTGLERSTPVSYLRDDSGIWVTTGDKWPKYVIDNDTFRVRFRGRWSTARCVPIDDPEASLKEHMRLFDAHGWFRWLAWIPKKDGAPDAAAVRRAIAAGRKLIRIDLRPSEG